MTQTNKVESQQHAQRLRWAEMALEALRNVIKNNPGALRASEDDQMIRGLFVIILMILIRDVNVCTVGSETECIGHFKLLFSLLRVHGAGKVQQLALEVRMSCNTQYLQNGVMATSSLFTCVCGLAVGGEYCHIKPGLCHQHRRIAGSSQSAGAAALSAIQ